ncbi:hypothetical protein BDZ85DRAFT_280477 [Elsinoe ampelina]|uniref:Elongator complex protein 5 n=1 Tax=Elsinoe ampelina TaxID=302913 RepID=A0A6A6GI30_9PEZI|nr:hypothetical protein BDZ85DRAFT_280477 [Elsinoe ampelina]
MSTRNRIPPLLDAYIKLPPEASLLLLTGVSNATPHWVTTRFLSRFFSQPAKRRPLVEEQDAALDADTDNDDVVVVLVSWMRDFDFWKTDARRGAGLDLSRLATEKRFAFIDGLSNLFTPPSYTTEEAKVSPSAQARTTSIPSRSGPLPHRSPVPSRAPPSVTTPDKPHVTSPTRQIIPGITHVTSPALSSTLATITSAITSLQAPSRSVFLILDSPTLLLAAVPDITPTTLSSFILSLRSRVHSTLLVTEADSPFLAASAPDAFLSAGDYLHSVREGGGEGKITPLEIDHAAFLVGQAHQAKWVMSVKGLETGTARDVSGVVTVRRGGGWDEELEEGELGFTDRKDHVKGAAGEEEGREMEALYRVGLDGGVKVFERGAGDVG